MQDLIVIEGIGIQLTSIDWKFLHVVVRTVVEAFAVA